MLTLLIVLMIAAGIAYLVTTREEFARGVATVRHYAQPIRAEMERCQVATTPFRATLRARTPWAIVTPAIFGLNAAIFIVMLFEDGALSATNTLVAWGGSVGLQTTNGEWWRLVTAIFVHGSLLQLLATCVGLVQLGRMLERLVGPFTFVCVYFAAGVFANLVSIAETPLVVQTGAAGAIFGIYGLLLAVTTWGLLRGTGVKIPLIAFRSLAPTAAAFLLYSLVTEGLMSRPNFAGFIVGLVSGLALTRDVAERKPDRYPTGLTMAAVVTVMIVVAMPLRGFVDVGPQIADVVALEGRTLAPYKTAVDDYRKGRIKVQALTDLINGTIMPQLHDARVRVEALDGVLAEHEPLVADAEEYLRLREASWRLRVAALHAGSMQRLREADNAERASLEALQRLRRKAPGA